MHPAIDLGIGTIGAYRLFTLIALGVGVAATVRMGRRRGTPRGVMATVVAASLGGALIGGRLWAVATGPDPSWAALLSPRFGTMAIFGGIAGGALGGIAAAGAFGRSPLRLADAAAPGVAAGIALLRVGCLLAGCCFGKETTLPWAITYPEGSLAHLAQRGESLWTVLADSHPVHPIPVYEMVAAVLLGGIALWILGRDLPDGSAFAAVVGGYALVRLLIHPLRHPEPGVTPAWFDPAVYLVVAALAVAWLVTTRTAPSRAPAAAPLRG